MNTLTKTNHNLEEIETENFLEWNFQLNEETGELEFQSAELSDGTPVTEESFTKAIKKAAGTSNPQIGERILKSVAKGLSAEDFDQWLNQASAMLPSLNPKNATEALLLGQFLALEDSGMKCLRLANLQDMFFHVEKLFTLATKLFNTANQTMQALTKFRSGGQQTVQMLHVHNEGQVIVAQNLSSKSNKGGGTKKSSIKPHGSLWASAPEKVSDRENVASNGQSEAKRPAVCTGVDPQDLRQKLAGQTLELQR